MSDTNRNYQLPPQITETRAAIATEDGLYLQGQQYQPDIFTKVFVMCHPNPAQGGTMDNKVVTTAVRTAAAAGYATLRFNFRGVGGSSGTITNGIKEPLDVLAALSFVKDWKAQVTVLGGFSFGSAMSAQVVASGTAVERLILVGPPLSRFVVLRPPVPKSGIAVIVGDQDEFCPVQAAEQYVANLQDSRCTLTVIPSAGHFFHGRLDHLSSALHAALLL